MTEETIFAAALEQADHAERVAYLERACAGNEALRRRVEALLGSHDGAVQFLREPVLKQIRTTEERDAAPSAGRPLRRKARRVG